MIKLIIMSLVILKNNCYKNYKFVDWKDGFHKYNNNTFKQEFFNSNIESSYKIYDKNCINNFMCLKNFIPTKDTCFKNNEIYKNITLNYETKNDSTKINELKDCLFDDLEQKIKIFYNENRKKNCIDKRLDTFDKLQIEVKTSLIALFKNLPKIFNEHGEEFDYTYQNLSYYPQKKNVEFKEKLKKHIIKIKENINHNFLNCNFKELSNNVRNLTRLQGWKNVIYNNIADLLNSRTDKYKNDTKKKIIIVIDFDDNISTEFYKKIINFIKNFVDEVNNSKLEIGFVKYKNDKTYYLKLKHYNELITEEYLEKNLSLEDNIFNNLKDNEKKLNKIFRIIENSNNLLIASHIFYFSNINLIYKSDEFIKKIEENGFLFNYIKVGKFNHNEKKYFEKSNRLYFSVLNKETFVKYENSFLTFCKNKSEEINKSIKFNEINDKKFNLISNQKIKKNTKLLFKIVANKKRMITFKINNQNALNNNDISLMASIENFPNCIVQDVFKIINKNDNEVKLIQEFSNTILRRKRIFNFDRCLGKYNLKNFENENIIFKNFLKQIKIFKPLNWGYDEYFSKWTNGNDFFIYIEIEFKKDFQIDIILENSNNEHKIVNYNNPDEEDLNKLKDEKEIKIYESEENVTSSGNEETTSSIVNEENASSSGNEETTSSIVNEENASSSGNEETTSSIVNEETTSSIVNEETTSSIVNEETTSSIVNEETTSSIVNEETTSSIVNEETTSSIVNEETTSSIGNEETTSSSGNEETTSSIENEESTSSIENEENASSSGNEETTSSIGNEETTSSIGNEETTSSSGNEETTSSIVNEETTSSIGNEETTSSIVNEETTSSIGNEETTSSSGNEETTSSIVNEENASSSGNKETTSSSLTENKPKKIFGIKKSMETNEQFLPKKENISNSSEKDNSNSNSNEIDSSLSENENNSNTNNQDLKITYSNEISKDSIDNERTFIKKKISILFD